jgi:hypothetical protein
MPYISVYVSYKRLRFLVTVKCPVPTLSLKANEEKMWPSTSNFIRYKIFKWQTMLLYVRKENGPQNTVIFCLDNALLLC